MKLQAKINSKYLDLLLSGEKEAEYRQFETITLTDELGRSRVFEITKTGVVIRPHKLYDKYPDVTWDKNKQIIKLTVKPLK